MGPGSQLRAWDPTHAYAVGMPRPLIALLAAVLLAGCGADGGGGSTSSAQTPTATPAKTPTPSPTATASATPGPAAAPVAAALRRYAAAVRRGDARTICRDLLAREVLQRVERAGGSCVENLIEPRVAEGGPSYAISIRSIEVDGDRAVAEITATESDGPRSSTQPLVRERGRWRLGVG